MPLQKRTHNFPFLIFRPWTFWRTTRFRFYSSARRSSASIARFRPMPSSQRFCAYSAWACAAAFFSRMSAFRRSKSSTV